MNDQGEVDLDNGIRVQDMVPKLCGEDLGLEPGSQTSLLSLGWLFSWPCGKEETPPRQERRIRLLE